MFIEEALLLLFGTELFVLLLTMGAEFLESLLLVLVLLVLVLLVLLEILGYGYVVYLFGWVELLSHYV